MIPLTILAPQVMQGLLTTNDAFTQQIAALAAASNANIPLITSDQVILSSASPILGDRDVQLTYPRVCLYSCGVKNTQVEKFVSLSGAVSVIADIWASSNLATDTDQWIHFYLEAFTALLRQNRGDWGQGLFFSGVYEVVLQPPQPGGLGFVQSGRVSCNLNVSRS
jgi:hypothetical protein